MEHRKDKMVFFLMTKKGFKVLKAIIEQNLHTYLEAVVVGQDATVQDDYTQKMFDLCEKNNITYTTDRRSLKFKAEYFFCVSWRWILDTDESKKIIVLHESLLPKYRGFAPLVHQLINGEQQLGVTALLATQNYDEGPIIMQEKVMIQPPVRIQEAIDEVIPLYQKIACFIAENYIKTGKTPPLKEQDHSLASYSLWRDQEDYRIDWNWSAERIKRHIYAVGYPYLGATTELKGEKIVITDVQVLEDLEFEVRMPGKVFRLEDGLPVVVCGTGLLKITAAAYSSNGKNVFPLKKLRLRLQ